jgi:pimeloyl-ACP methyl ester carboxylesterase
VTAPEALRIPLPDIALAAQAWGDRSAPPLLALHGWLDNAGSFAGLAPLLVPHFRVIALDLPGHGHSDHMAAGASYHYLDHVRMVLAAIESLQLDHCTLLGHSLGAGVASLVAAAAPGRIERLILIEGLGPLGDDGSQTLQRFRDAFAQRDGGARPLRTFRSIEQAVVARSMASRLPPELARPIVERGLLDTGDGWRWRSDPRLTRPSAIRLAEAQVHALLRGIDAPTSLLLAQPAASYLPMAAMQSRMDCVGAITVRHLEGGHHLHLEQPQVVAGWIRDEAAS